MEKICKISKGMLFYISGSVVGPSHDEWKKGKPPKPNYWVGGGEEKKKLKKKKILFKMGLLAQDQKNPILQSIIKTFEFFMNLFA